MTHPTPPRTQIRVLPDATACCQALADHLPDWFAPSGDIHIALSGGNTARDLYPALAANARLPWPRIHLWWVDERLVPPSDARSNYAAARALLLERVPVGAAQVHRIRGEDPPAQAAGDYDRQLCELAGEHAQPLFDLVLLGIGEDGHTASLFPVPTAQWQGRHCLRVAHPDDGTMRVSLTANVLMAARRTVFLVCGAAKQAIIERILDGSAPELPASRIAAGARDLHWYLDRAAAPRHLPARN